VEKRDCFDLFGEKQCVYNPIVQKGVIAEGADRSQTQPPSKIQPLFQTGNFGIGYKRCVWRRGQGMRQNTKNKENRKRAG
jgi:hypothetical protein